MMSIFLSHNYLDKPFVRKLASDLEKFKIRVWLDEAEIKLGDSLIEKIRSGIDEVDYVAVFISKNSINSEWVKKEIDIAMNQEIEEKKVKVLPLLLDDCDLPGFLKGKLYADFRYHENYEIELAKLIERLTGYSLTKEYLEITQLASSHPFKAVDNIIAGQRASQQVLIDLSIVLFSMIDGSLSYFLEDEVIRFFSYFSNFCNCFPPANYALLYTANGWNKDYVKAAAIYGLYVGKTDLASKFFEKAMKSKSVDLYDKVRALDYIRANSHARLDAYPIYVQWASDAADGYGTHILEEFQNDVIGGLLFGIKPNILNVKSSFSKWREIYHNKIYIEKCSYPYNINHLERREKNIAIVTSEINSLLNTYPTNGHLPSSDK